MPAQRDIFLNWRSFAVMSNVVCNENSVFNLHMHCVHEKTMTLYTLP